MKNSYQIQIGIRNLKPWIFKKSNKNSTYLFKEYLVVAKIRGSHFLLPLDQHFTYIKGLSKAEKTALRKHIDRLIAHYEAFQACCINFQKNIFIDK